MLQVAPTVTAYYGVGCINNTCMHTLTYHAHKVHKLTYNAVNAYWELASIKFELLQKLRGGDPCYISLCM